MTRLDRWLQSYRIRVALDWIPDEVRILDIGCHQGELFQVLGSRLRHAVGIDPLARPISLPNYQLLPIGFDGVLPFRRASFDVVVLLATLEHIVKVEELAGECERVLDDRGHVILTVPSPHVDLILHALRLFRLADGMSLEQHHGFLPESASGLFAPFGFKLVGSSSFQLGFNHMFVLRKS